MEADQDRFGAYFSRRSARRKPSVETDDSVEEKPAEEADAPVAVDSKAPAGGPSTEEAEPSARAKDGPAATEVSAEKEEQKSRPAAEL